MELKPIMELKKYGLSHRAQGVLLAYQFINLVRYTNAESRWCKSMCTGMKCHVQYAVHARVSDTSFMVPLIVLSQ